MVFMLLVSSKPMKVGKQAMTVHKSNTLPRNSTNRERKHSASTLSPVISRRPTHTRQSSQPDVSGNIFECSFLFSLT